MTESNLPPGDAYKSCPACGQGTPLNTPACGLCGHQFPPPMPPSLTQAFYSVRPRHLDEAASKKLACGLCGILLTWFGIHKFLLGYTGAGLVMLLGTILTCGIGGIVFGIIGLVEGIIYLTKSDEEFYATYIAGRKEWF